MHTPTSWIIWGNEVFRERKARLILIMLNFQPVLKRVRNLLAEVAKNGNFIDLKVAAIGNYLPHGRSCQKWQFLLTSKLPQMATTCFMTEVAKNGNKWLHIIAKNGNKQNDLQLYRELKSLFCHFWQNFAFSSVIMLSKNCQK